MPIISYIPPEYKDGFKKIATMEQSEFAKIEDGLNDAALTSSIAMLSLNIENAKQVHHLSLEEIFSSVGALIEFLEDRKDVEKVASDVASLMSPNELTVEQLDALQTRLTILLDDKKIYYAYKSRRLITENANNFISCRIVSDIRPIFDFDIEQEPIAGVITHNLHIHYDSELNGIHKDFFICLDSSDIENLIEALIRAERKEESLGKLLKKSGITNLND